MDMIGTGHETAIQDTSIAWGEMGSGYPLVLLHGLYDSHRTWRRVASMLSLRFRVLMPDLPGHGNSGHPDAPYTLSWHAQMVAAWMEAIGVETAHVCGHSYGGGVAQWMLLDQRSRINRLALVSAGGLGRAVAPGMRLATFPVLGRLLAPKLLHLAVPLALRCAPALYGHMEPEERELFLRMSRIPGADRAFQRTLEGVINIFGQYMQTTQRAHEIADMPPIALFWGSDDPFIPIRHGRDAVARTENISLTTYPGCGHYAQLDAPEAFAHDLTEFLLDPDRPAARFHPPPPHSKTWRRQKPALERTQD
ncbi:MAG: alpha/beta fold hydrolase [Myxococcales bacterium]|nr:MAG: alpha/beta fold hydrolase [Myxococcales bacterium]